MTMPVRVADLEVIAPNFKRRLSGVTSTIVQLLPRQVESLAIAALGPGLPGDLPKLSWWKIPALWSRPKRRPFRIWHARRNVEMIAGILLRSVLRMPLKLVFTSAAQRDHRRFTRFLIGQMDSVVATSRRSGSFLEVPHTVVMHGVDCQRFHPSRGEDDTFAASGLPGRYAIGCFGRIRHQKGNDLFVQAMIALLPDRPGWTAVISGRVTPEHYAFHQGLVRQIADAGLEQRIVFLGEVPDIRPWYRRISLLVAPSRNEGFGLTPLEAMASATAVVTSDAGAYSEMVEEGVTGAVTPAGDGEVLTAAIARYMDDPVLAAAHGRNARCHVEESFALGNEVRGLRAVYDALWQSAT